MHVIGLLMFYLLGTDAKRRLKCVFSTEGRNILVLFSSSKAEADRRELTGPDGLDPTIITS